MKKWIFKLFRISNWKRWLIVCFTLLASFLFIILGSTLYLNKDNQTNTDFGGGTKIQLEVKQPTNENLNATAGNSSTAASNLVQRFSTNQNIKVEYDGGNTITIIQRNGTNAQNKNFIDDILNKTPIILTTVDGYSLFDNGQVNSALSGSAPSQPSQEWNNPALNDPNSSNFDNYFQQFEVPLTTTSAASVTDKEGTVSIKINLNSQYDTGLKTVTQFISENYKENPQIAVWLNLPELITQAKQSDLNQWKAANFNPYNFIYQDNNFESKTLKPQYDNAQYLLGTETIAKDTTNSSGGINITGNFNETQANTIVAQLEYSNQNTYSLNPNFSSLVYLPSEVSPNNFSYILYAGLAILIIIAIYLIYAFGLLGAVGGLTIGGFVAGTLIIFKSFNGSFSLATFAALIIAIGISLDAIILVLGKFKEYIYQSNSLQKSEISSRKSTFIPNIDANFMLFIFAIIIFFVGQSIAKDFSIITLISIAAFLVFSILIFRLIFILLIRTHYFDNKLWLLGIRKKAIAKKMLQKENKISPKQQIKKNDRYLTIAKWSSLTMLLIIIITFSVFGAIYGLVGLSSALNTNINIVGGNFIRIAPINTGSQIDANLANNIQQAIVQTGIVSSNNIFIHSVGLNEYNIFILTPDALSTAQFALIQNSVANIVSTQHIIVSTPSDISSFDALKQLLWVILALGISMILVFIYCAFKFKWPVAIALISSLLIDALLLFSAYIIFRIEFTQTFAALLIAIVMYSLNDKMVFIANYKRQLLFNTSDKMSNDTLKQVSTKAVRKTFKRSAINLSMMILLTLILFAFAGNATPVWFNAALLVGIVISFITTYFFMTYLIYRLEIIRIKRQIKRIKKDYWNTDYIKEQTFAGINSFEP